MLPAHWFPILAVVLILAFMGFIITGWLRFRRTGRDSVPETACHLPGMLLRARCEICGLPTATIEIIPPHTLPSDWGKWEKGRRKEFTKYRAAEHYQLIYDGPGGSSCACYGIDRERAEQIVAAFSAAPSVLSIRSARFYDDAGFCAECGCFYCPEHWAISDTGFGRCPRGHGKSLDPHWHPPFDEQEP